LTIAYLPFIYLFSLIANYEMAFTGINWATTDRRARWCGKAALLTKFHFPATGPVRLSMACGKATCDRADVFSRACAVIADFQKSRQEVRKAQPAEGVA
jgi:hypothetical protein